MTTTPTSVEAVINKKLHELAKEIFNEYSVRIDNVQFEYTIVETIGQKPHAIRASVKMLTTYMPDGEL